MGDDARGGGRGEEEGSGAAQLRSCPLRFGPTPLSLSVLAPSSLVVAPVAALRAVSPRRTQPLARSLQRLVGPQQRQPPPSSPSPPPPPRPRPTLRPTHTHGRPRERGAPLRTRTSDTRHTNDERRTTHDDELLLPALLTVCWLWALALARAPSAASRVRRRALSSSSSFCAVSSAPSSPLLVAAPPGPAAAPCVPCRVVSCRVVSRVARHSPASLRGLPHLILSGHPQPPCGVSSRTSDTHTRGWDGGRAGEAARVARAAPLTRHPPSPPRGIGPYGRTTHNDGPRPLAGLRPAAGRPPAGPEAMELSASDGHHIMWTDIWTRDTTRTESHTQTADSSSSVRAEGGPRDDGARAAPRSNERRRRTEPRSRTLSPELRLVWAGW